MVRRVNHIAIAVRDTAAALQLYADALGLKAHPAGRLDSEGVYVTFVQADGTCLEILEPLAPETPVGRFIAKRGEGLHHICLEVDDLAAACAELSTRGYNVVDREPRRGAHGELLVFVHPSSTSGVLIELYQAGSMQTASPSGSLVDEAAAGVCGPGREETDGSRG